MLRSKTARIALALLPLVAAALVFVVLRGSDTSGNDEPLLAFPPPAPAPADSLTSADFAGSASCAGCHRTQHAAWSGSTHGRAGEAPPRELLLRRFDGTPIRFRDAVVEPRVNGGQYEFVVKWAERTDRYPIEGVVGAAHMMGGGTQGFLWRHPDGSLRLLPFEITGGERAWFCNTVTRGNRGWALITETMSIAECGDWPPVRVLGSSARFASCQECHGSQIELREQNGRSESRFTSLSINCESCHGPARRHVEAMRDPEARSADAAPKPLATLTRDASVALCSSCHAVKVNVQRGFLPGQNLDERYSLKYPLLRAEETLPDGRTRTFAYQQGHYYSDCFLSGSMTCVDCHEPHGQSYRDVNGRALSGKLDDGQCTACHAAKAGNVEAHTRHPAQSPGSRCVSCHMPFLQQPAVGGQVRYARSDHTISIPRPEIDTQLGVASACAACHSQKNAEQIDADTRRLWGELKPLRPVVSSLIRNDPADLEASILAADTTHAFAYFNTLARYYSATGTPDENRISRPLRARLWQLTQSRDDDFAALALATLHLRAGRDGATRQRLADRLNTLGPRAQSVRRRWAIALGQHGDALRARARFGDAHTLYSKALEVVPGEPSFLLAQGQARLDLRDPAGATEVFRRTIEADSTNSLAWVNYGHARGAAGDGSGARAAYLRATRVNPWDAIAFFSLGNSYVQEQRSPDAVAAYQRAIELDVSLAAAHFNLARVLLSQDRKREALAAIRTGLIFEPGHGDARDAARQLETELRSR